MPIGNRENNPGNVSLPIKGWTGGGTIIGAPGQPGYASFPDFSTGVAAWSQRLDTYAQRPGGNTIRGLNDTIGYATDPNWKNNVAAGSGLGLDTPLDSSNRGALMVGIAKAEGNWGSMSTDQRELLTNAGSTGYRPPYDNFSPSGMDLGSQTAPGSFSDRLPWHPGYDSPSTNVSGDVKAGAFGDFGSSSIGNSTGEDGTQTAPSFSTDPKTGMSADEYIDGQNVSTPEAGSQGTPSDVPTAIVTASNQEAKTTASAAKTTAEATLNATKQQTASDAKLQGEQQGFVANWAVRIFLFVVGAIFLAGGLFLFGGQTIFQSKTVGA